MQKAYRIFENKNGFPCTLYHGISKTRKLPLNRKVIAVKRIVTNPGKSKEGKKFLSGFHVCRTLDEAQNYMNRFSAKNKTLTICRVFVDKFRDKPNSQIKLADQMLIKSKDWYDGIHYVF